MAARGHGSERRAYGRGRSARSIADALHALRPDAESMRGHLTNAAVLDAYFLARMPLGAFAGLRVKYLDHTRCEATIPYGWRTRNPFGSTYFAALSMAAELSTGALALVAVRAAPEPISMLLTDLTASFEKRATGLTTFTSEDGAPIAAAVDEAARTGEGVKVNVETIGRGEDGTVLARFAITWSFKRKANR